MVTRLSRAPLEGRGRERRWHCRVAWCVELHGVWRRCMVCGGVAWVCGGVAWCVEGLHGCGWREDRIKHESYIGIESQ